MWVIGRDQEINSLGTGIKERLSFSLTAPALCVFYVAVIWARLSRLWQAPRQPDHYSEAEGEERKGRGLGNRLHVSDGERHIGVDDGGGGNQPRGSKFRNVGSPGLDGACEPNRSLASGNDVASFLFPELVVFAEFVVFPEFVVFRRVRRLPGARRIARARRIPGARRPRMRAVDGGLNLQKYIARLNIRTACNLRRGKAEEFVVGDCSRFAAGID